MTPTLARPPLVQSVGGYTEGSPVSYQKQFEAALGVLLVLWTSLSPLEQTAYRRVIQESDRTDRIIADPTRLSALNQEGY